MNKNTKENGYTLAEMKHIINDCGYHICRLIYSDFGKSAIICAERGVLAANYPIKIYSCTFKVSSIVKAGLIDGDED